MLQSSKELSAKLKLWVTQKLNQQGKNFIPISGIII